MDETYDEHEGEQVHEHEPEHAHGREHDHEHSHEHDRGHGRHRDHDHGHEHEHNHGHHHDHEHEHSHDHHHEHENALQLTWADITLSSHTHDQASVVSAAIKVREEGNTTFEALIGALRSIAVAAEAAGGIVGHIKGFARTGEAFVHASCTDANQPPQFEGDAAFALGPESQVELVAIVMLIELEELEHIVEEALQAIA